MHLLQFSGHVSRPACDKQPMDSRYPIFVQGAIQRHPPPSASHASWQSQLKNPNVSSYARLHYAKLRSSNVFAKPKPPIKGTAVEVVSTMHRQSPIHSRFTPPFSLFLIPIKSNAVTRGQGTNMEKIFVIRTFGIMSHHVACRCRCKHVTHARILTPNLDLFCFFFPSLAMRIRWG
ncbi:hypothetical protein BDR22DRAFT_852937 [Usnea florida]